MLLDGLWVAFAGRSVEVGGHDDTIVGGNAEDDSKSGQHDLWISP
ncbi:MAG: hypothetical protein OTJ44_01620 [Planctomycetota bacterium]|nr:hypothetical protein [Planctomycetota bacterium]